MKSVLNTNICIYIIKKRPPGVLKELQKIDVSEVCISSISVAELEYGIEKSSSKNQNRIALAEFLAPIEILPFTDEQASEYGRIRIMLEKNGTPIGPYELQIAAHALSLNLTLITNNIKEFVRVPKLKIDNWV